MKYIRNLLLVCFIALGLLTIVGSNGGGDSSTTPSTDTTTPDVVVLSDADMLVNSGRVDGGVARTSTQTMTGSVPNPTGSSDTYEGKAYLVLNGDRIPLDVTQSTGSSSRGLGRIIYKGGKEYYLDDPQAIDSSVLSKLSARNGNDVLWVFSVMFSINAGRNTLY